MPEPWTPAVGDDVLLNRLSDLPATVEYAVDGRYLCYYVVSGVIRVTPWLRLEELSPPA